MSIMLSYAIKFVANMDAAVRFHRDKLGLTLRFESPDWSEFETGTTTLALHLANPEHPAGTCELGFGVPNVGAFYAEKSERGVNFTSAPKPLGEQRIATFRDPDGAEGSVVGA